MTPRSREQHQRPLKDRRRAHDDTGCAHQHLRGVYDTPSRLREIGTKSQPNADLSRGYPNTPPPLQGRVREGCHSPIGLDVASNGNTSPGFISGIKIARARNNIWLCFMIVSMLLACIPQLAIADESKEKIAPSTLLKHAQDAYDQAVALQSPNGSKVRTLFSEALKSYEAVLDQDINNAGLLFNAGNAAYRLGRYAQAIVYYRRALLVEPNSTDIQQNLELARRQVDLQIAPPTERKMLASVLAYDRWLAPTVWKYLAYFGYLAFWVLLTVRVARNGQTTRPPMAAMLCCLLVAGIAGRAFWLAADRFENPAAGVVARGQTDLLKGNGSGYQRRIDEPLPAGVEFELLEQRPDPDKRLWYRIRLADGTDGWILAERALLI